MPIKGLPRWLRNRRLSLRLVVAILLVSSVITLLITAIQLHVEYRRDLARLEQRLVDAGDSVAHSLAASLWAMDQTQLRVQLRGLAQLPDVHEVELSGDIPMRVGPGSDYRHQRSHEFPLVYRTYDGVRHQLGQVEIRANLAAAHNRIRERLWMIAASQAVKTFLVSVLLLAVFYYLVTRHLNRLAEFASALRLDHLHLRARLERPEQGLLRPDELDELAAALNYATDRIGKDMRVHEETRTQQALLTEALHQCPAGVMIMDRDGHISYTNPRFEEFCGLSGKELHGRAVFGTGTAIDRNIRLLDNDGTDPWIAVREQGEWHGDIRFLRDDGQFRWAHASLRRILGSNGDRYIALLEDTTQLRDTQTALDLQTYFDPVSELPKRITMYERLAMLLHAIGTPRAALVFLDIDNFKLINESLGHDAGDVVIRAIAERLRRAVPAGWQPGHFGGDDFMLMIAEPAGEQELAEEVRAVMGKVSEPVRYGDQELHVSLTAGMALSPGAGITARELFQAADAAVNQAKTVARGTLAIFDPELSRRSHQRLTLESDLRRALAEGQLLLHYQPITATRGTRTVAVEALVRWMHPEHGLIGPGRFIPVAEQAGLINPLGEWVLRQGLNDLKALRGESGLEELRLSVNASPQQIMDEGFARLVAEALADAGLPGTALQIEITEEIFLNDLDRSRETLSELERLGVALAVDDFGTGYSALGYLKQLDVHVLKVDQSFIRDLGRSEQDTRLVRAIVSLAQGLQLEVVAEGVETEAQRQLLGDMGCEYIQGWLNAPPLPLPDLRQRLREQDGHD